MCVIAAKPIGVDLPSDELFQNMWHRNPDGAGFMYADNGKVIIEKGFMKYEDFEKRLNEVKASVDLKNTGAVFHFRISTHGGVKPENTHPFPLTDNIPVMQKLRMTTSVGIAHNGVISIKTRTKDISDTMEYIASVVAPLSKMRKNFYADKDAMQIIEKTADSKLAFLTGDGSIYLTSGFEQDNGIMYSNTSYKGWSMYYGTGGKSYVYGYGGWDDIDDYYPGYSDYRLPSHQTDEEYSDYDEYEARHIKSKSVNRFLMDMDEIEGAYILWDDGTFTTSEDSEYIFAIDRDGRLWKYDWELDVYMPETTGEMFDGKGRKPKYEFDKSECVLCYGSYGR